MFTLGLGVDDGWVGIFFSFIFLLVGWLVHLGGLLFGFGLVDE